MNQTNLLKPHTPWFRFPVQLLLFIAILILTMGVVTASQPQNSRKRATASDATGNATPKKVARNKPLTAADQRAAEQRLEDLGYWTGPVDGRWDATSHHALIAFQKVERLKPTGQMNRACFEALLAANRPSPLETGPAHIEVDLIRQVLFVVDDAGVVSHILPVSSGSGKEFKSQGWARDAITHPGRYKVLQKIPGWKKSPLGRLYYPVYFMYGTAIHGYQSVPTKPASHGCVRIPMVVAIPFFKMIPLGMPVIVHRGDPPPPLPLAALPSH
jgi:lipoprotein-anchoring transpeptidase ErfK/SrfK